MAGKQSGSASVWMTFLICGAAFLLFVHLATDSNDKSPTPTPADAAKAEQQQQFLWIEASKDAVRAQLKDGNSAQFRNVIFHRGKDGLPMVCGQVNSRNSYGAYGGYQLFAASGRNGPVVLQEQMEPKEFGKVMKRLCLDDAARTMANPPRKAVQPRQS